MFHTRQLLLRCSERPVTRLWTGEWLRKLVFSKGFLEDATKKSRALLCCLFTLAIASSLSLEDPRALHHLTELAHPALLAGNVLTKDIRKKINWIQRGWIHWMNLLQSLDLCGSPPAVCSAAALDPVEFLVCALGSKHARGPPHRLQQAKEIKKVDVMECHHVFFKYPVDNKQKRYSITELLL